MDRSALIDRLIAVCGERGVFHTRSDLMVYEYDGSVDGSVETALPVAVTLPTSAEQVAAIVKLANQAGLPVTARGAGTGLSGGAVTQDGGIIIAMTRMDRIIEIDRVDRTALVEPGVINLELSDTTTPLGMFFAPDPSSQRACTIGGNVAENSGGPHCLKYGVTSNHILGLEIVLENGEIVWTGGHAYGAPGYDLTGAMVGSEGMFGIVTKALVKLTPN
ncbi:MAG: FAD-binding oxidoreductase, partial [Thermomicrobiales bacterium]